jgi:hypothetical protein
VSRVPWSATTYLRIGLGRIPDSQRLFAQPRARATVATTTTCVAPIHPVSSRCWQTDARTP